ncbi:1,2-phenylacetyl-CoA epoxidase subunit PaaD [Streptomyces purpurogeneiscleroticus]|uniref:1,2-phenylacetyl-CoA epoxidase subunit PaaD n=1 Tax=Streptomyces purpurogeneiscleroticus TaxID=68259 RepID=UPI001CC0C540|nr:1,2-phenylacetyl-CoA epoxidase subunit PaaD [Streptomyces purpurogeneiscleroticus]MBZ4019136.1 phenylacetate-CoA oxygenase subunit PaaJ [Streptomyces purpurogeneiscleroticus]
MTATLHVLHDDGAAPETAAARARRTASEVVDPELPMVTLAELGVLRGVEVAPDGSVTATMTPTYSGCPAMAEMRATLAARLRAAGYADVRIETVLDPPWTTDWISEEGRRKLAEHGIAPPGPAPRRTEGPVLLDLSPTRRAVPCPRCGSADTEELSRFGATSCRALRRCRSCREPYEHVKEI